jgi:hypothetical protein
MFIVPLSGNRIKTTDNTVFTVLGYTNYENHPSVYVSEAGSGSKIITIPFTDIVMIDRAPVTLNAGKVFVVSNIPNGISLPQCYDIVDFGGNSIKVQMLKLNVRGHLSSGMLVHGLDTVTNQFMTRKLANMISIKRANGNTDYDLHKFRLKFSDYLGGGT